MKTIESTINNLEKNPLFQMSLGSKELFHSNILAWLMETDIEIAKHIFKNWALISSNELENIKIEREKYHIDLLITLTFNDNSKKIIIIENKLKSIPYPEQLDKYSKVVNSKYSEISDKTFILLSLTEPTFILPEGWIHKSYSDLYNAIDNITIGEGKNISFFSLNDILIAYKDFIKNLDDIYTNISTNKNYDFYDLKNNLINKFRDIRIHDLILKTVHQQISYSVIYRIKNELKLSNKRYREHLNEILDFSVGTGFTNSSGISDLKILIFRNEKVKYLLGIQLQANQFRFVSEVITENANIINNHIELALKLEEDKMWLLEGQSIIPNIDIVNDRKGYGKGRSDKHNFCEYDKGRFLYRYDFLTNENEIETIIEAFVSASKYIIEKSDDFNELAIKYFDE